MFKIRNAALFGALGLALTAQLPAQASDLVQDDLITGSNQTTPWQLCGTDSTGVDVTNLDAGLCAYRTTPAVAGTTYRMSCGVTVAKYSSITLAFLDADDNTLASKVTEVEEHVSGAYSVELMAPAGTAVAAIGIYGEPGSGFQDCVLIDATPPPEPTKGSISGITWFDENGDSVLDSVERMIPGSNVLLFESGADFTADTALALVQTDADGAYYFGNLDVDTCYVLGFSNADGTIELGFAGGENDALDGGYTAEVCLSDAVADVTDIDAAFVAIPPVVPPADYVVCGVTWIDRNENGVFDGTDTTKSNVFVKLFDIDAGRKRIATTYTDENGNFAFASLPEGNYTVRFHKPDGHELTTSSGQTLAGTSFVAADTGESPTFNLPGSGNTADGSACSIQHVNGGFIELPVALDPTVAEDDSVEFDQGVDFVIDFLANDVPCTSPGVAFGASRLNEINILGHNVPGLVTLIKNSTSLASSQFQVTDTTDFGTYSIEYGIRGACGSYDTATVTVELLEVIPPAPPAAPDAPECRIETRGQTWNGGVDVFNPAIDGFAPNYNLYDRDKNLVITVDSTDYTHKNLIGTDANQNEAPYIGRYEMEWNGTNFGFDQVSIYYISAVGNGAESELTECVRTSISPIALDLTNHGRVQRVTGNYSVDVDGDGIKEPLGQWFAPTAGILVTADAKGQISGEHMFGNVPGVHADGFAELATLDKNLDGQLTGKELSGLAIWTDLNSDTMVDEGELSSIADHQIVALAVEHYKFMARATKADGKSVLMEDVWLPLAPLASR